MAKLLVSRSCSSQILNHKHVQSAAAEFITHDYL